MRGKPRKLVAAGHGVHGDMDFDAVFMGKADGLGQLLRRKVSREGAHTEACPCQIDRIRAVENGHFQPLHIAGGR